MTLFLTDNIDCDICQLSAEESKHCVRVLRMGVGDELWLTDGMGTMCKARVIQPDDRECTVEVVERMPEYQRRNHHLHIAVAPTKNNARLEWFVEKAVEIGIDEITPVICDHSERGVLKTDRLEKIVVSAVKQSLKAYKPIVHEPIRLKDFLRSLSVESAVNRMICYCEGDQRTPLKEVYHQGEDALVLIGPEGDFSSQEVQMALQQGFHPVTLGDCRLRTETAALYAVTAINFLNS